MQSILTNFPEPLTFSENYATLVMNETSYIQAKFWSDLPPYGLYWIECNSTNRILIGQSSKIRTRWKNHRTMLNRQIHYSKQLQIDFNEFGYSNFSFYRILMFGMNPDKKERERCEQLLIEYIPQKNRYNRSKKGMNNPFYGQRLSIGSRYLISKSKKGKPSGFQNYNHSGEVKQAISRQNRNMSSYERSKPIFVEDILYPSITEASKATGYARKTIRKKANEGNNPNFRWRVGGE